MIFQLSPLPATTTTTVQFQTGKIHRDSQSSLIQHSTLVLKAAHEGFRQRGRAKPGDLVRGQEEGGRGEKDLCRLQETGGKKQV